MTPAIRARGLTKRYGDVVAVDGVSFEVEPGEVLCLLGPNGAGKTTTIECLEGYRRPDAGEVRVLGLDPAVDAKDLRRRIGVQLQEASLPARIKVGEALHLFSVLYERPSVDGGLLDRLGLGAKREAYFDALSGGQKQRLFVALALINDPEIVFLDEITTGLDPRARHDIWDLVRGIRERGATVVLTTHFMEEAEALADRVVILKSGRVVASDAPDALIASIRSDDEVRLRVEGAVDPAALREVEVAREVRGDRHELVVRGGGRGWIVRLVTAIGAQGAELVDLHSRRPTLEDVYLELTGEEEYVPTGEGEEPAAGARDGWERGTRDRTGGAGEAP